MYTRFQQSWKQDCEDSDWYYDIPEVWKEEDREVFLLEFLGTS